MVDDASEGPTSPTANGTASPRENGLDKLGPSSVPLSSQVKKEVPPPSPRSGTSSNASTPSAKKMEEREKPTTPISKPVTPTSAGLLSTFFVSLYYFSDNFQACIQFEMIMSMIICNEKINVKISFSTVLQ